MASYKKKFTWRYSMHPWEMTRKLATVAVVFERQKVIKTASAGPMVRRSVDSRGILKGHDDFSALLGLDLRSDVLA